MGNWAAEGLRASHSSSTNRQKSAMIFFQATPSIFYSLEGVFGRKVASSHDTLSICFSWAMLSVPAFRKSLPKPGLKRVSLLCLFSVKSVLEGFSI